MLECSASWEAQEIIYDVHWHDRYWEIASFTMQNLVENYSSGVAMLWGCCCGVRWNSRRLDWDMEHLILFYRTMRKIPTPTKIRDRGNIVLDDLVLTFDRCLTAASNRHPGLWDRLIGASGAAASDSSHKVCLVHYDEAISTVLRCRRGFWGALVWHESDFDVRRPQSDTEGRRRGGPAIGSPATKGKPSNEVRTWRNV